MRSNVANFDTVAVLPLVGDLDMSAIFVSPPLSRLSHLLTAGHGGTRSHMCGQG